MDRGSRRLPILGIVLGLGTGLCGLAITTAAPAPARDTPLAIPVLNDGEWTGTLGASGTFDIAQAQGEVAYQGAFRLTVFQGAITGGTWQIAGGGVAVHPRVSGNVTYLESGVMAGSAGLPEMLPDGATLAYDLTVQGVPMSGTVEFGPAELTSVAVPLLSASCDLAVGNWTFVANMMYTQAGGSSSITGYWYASRVGGSELGTEDQATLDEGYGGLLRRGNAVAASAYETGQVDIQALNDLIEEGEWFNQRLTLNRQCGDRTLLGWVNPLGQTVLGLLDWALDNPDQFSDSELLGLIAAAVRTNVLGSRSPDNELTLDVRGRLAEELPRRAEAARQADSCGGVAVVYAAATTLNDPAVVAAVRGVMAEVCP